MGLRVERWEREGGEIGRREGLEEGEEGCVNCFEEVFSYLAVDGRFHK